MNLMVDLIIRVLITSCSTFKFITHSLKYSQSPFFKNCTFSGRPIVNFKVQIIFNNKGSRHQTFNRYHTLLMKHYNNKRLRHQTFNRYHTLLMKHQNNKGLRHQTFNRYHTLLMKHQNNKGLRHQTFNRYHTLLMKHH